MKGSAIARLVLSIIIGAVIGLVLFMINWGLCGLISAGVVALIAAILVYGLMGQNSLKSLIAIIVFIIVGIMYFYLLAFVSDGNSMFVMFLVNFLPFGILIFLISLMNEINQANATAEQNSVEQVTEKNQNSDTDLI